MKKAIKITAFALLSLLFLLLILSASIAIFGNYDNETEIDSLSTVKYKMSELFKENGDTLVTDIAMLGSHDSFSNNITSASKIDPAEKSSYIAFPIVNQITAHFAKAQTKNAFKQAEKGVRYFDIRLSFDSSGELYTKHALLSEKFNVNLELLLNFSAENDGELFVLDFQHVYLNGMTSGDLFNAIDSVKLDGKSIFDFIHYDTSKIALADLTYDDVTKNGTETGFVILFKNETVESLTSDANYQSFKDNQMKFYSRDDSIISTWHNKLSDEDMYSGIDAELQNLKKTNPQGVFIVNQAQKTPPISPQNLFLNLLHLADDFNHKHLQRNFENQLSVMPIFMVDNATTDAYNFNFDIMTKIKNYNMNLK